MKKSIRDIALLFLFAINIFTLANEEKITNYEELRSAISPYVFKKDIVNTKKIIQESKVLSSSAQNLLLDAESNLLHIAAYFDIQHAIKSLIKVIDVNSLGYNNFTALHIASTHRHYYIVKLLLKNGAFPDAVNSFKETPLTLSIYYRHSNITELLLKHNANIKIKNNYSNFLLHSAVLNGDIATIKVLIKYGVNVNEMNEYGNTPMHFAAGVGSIDIIKLLLKFGAHPHLKNQEGFYPIAYAIATDNEEAVLFLLNLKQ